MRRRSPVTTRELKHRHVVRAAVLVRQGLSIRQAMKEVNAEVDPEEHATVGSIHRELHPREGTPARVGRPPALSAAAEERLRTAIVDFQAKGFSITKLHLRHVVADVIADLPPEEQAKWRDRQPSIGWVRRFCQRHSLRLRLENRVESARARATTKANVAQHLSILAHLIKTHDLTAERISNWDETGFSLGSLAASKSKVLIDPKTGRSLSRGVSVSKDSEHITLGAAVTASGRAYSPLFVLPGTEAKYRELEGGGVETPADYLPQDAKVFYRTPAGVDSDIMLGWVDSYLAETVELRRTGKTLVVFDGYSSHLSLRVLLRLLENNVIAHALPAHTSHFTQPLDVTVFGPMKGVVKERVSAYVNNPANVLTKFTVYTACELITGAYSAAMTSANIKSGFARAGLWPLSAAAFTDDTFAISVPYQDDDDADAVDPWEDVHERFFARGESLANSVVVTSTGTVSSTAGCHVSSEAVLAVLKARAAAKAQAARDKLAAAAAAAQKKVDRAAAKIVEAARKADALAERTASRAAAEARKRDAAQARADSIAAREAARLAALATASEAREEAEESRLRALALPRAAVRRNARSLSVRIAIAKRRTLDRTLG